MRIQCYDDFVHELKSAGFTLVGENPDGIFSLGTLFGEKIRWHTEDPETDPWEWRMRVLEERDDIAYGKLFFKKGGFITREWYLRCTCSSEPRAFRGREARGLIPPSSSCR